MTYGQSRVRVKALFLAGLMGLVSARATAQSPAPASSPAAQSGRPADGDAGLATRTGHELHVSVGHYDYIEPGPDISIHGPKFGGEYTGAVSFGSRRQWFTRGELRGAAGHVTYDGWCAPYLIRPSSSSPNGYDLGIGDFSPCSESGDSDWYVEGRGLIGKDYIAGRWGLSPHTGLGVRHLSNGTTGVAGYRTDDYLYLPLGLTARTRVASRSALSVVVESDLLLRGWQTTHQSKLGSGDIPATATAPAFTIDGFTDLSFAQHRGWALRTSAKYQITNRWSVEPAYIRWSVGDSEIDYTTATFIVNGITARQQMGAYEPENVTHEWYVNLGFHF